MNELQGFLALDDWFLSAQGQELATAFATELRMASVPSRGETLLQLGNCGNNLWLEEFAYPLQWIIAPELWDKSRGIIGSVNAIPMERESIDCILAPLTLEICGPEKNPIDEIDRILKPMGYVIFFGINPWSFWGASLRWGRLSAFAQASATFSSSLRLKHAMVSRGYEQCRLSSFYYLPPLRNDYWLKKLSFLNHMSKMVCPYPAGFYCLILQKLNPCMTAVSFKISQDWALAPMSPI